MYIYVHTSTCTVVYTVLKYMYMHVHVHVLECTHCCTHTRLHLNAQCTKQNNPPTTQIAHIRQPIRCWGSKSSLCLTPLHTRISFSRVRCPKSLQQNDVLNKTPNFTGSALRRSTSKRCCSGVPPACPIRRSTPLWVPCRQDKLL